MLRYVYIGDQIACDGDYGSPPAKQFAFFNTVTNTFETFIGEQVFDSRECFLELEAQISDPEERKRFSRAFHLIPKEVP